MEGPSERPTEQARRGSTVKPPMPAGRLIEFTYT
jgi:hypothetical protein